MNRPNLKPQAKPQPAASRLSPARYRQLARLAYRTELLSRVVQAQADSARAKPAKSRRPSPRQLLVAGLIVLILGVTGYVTVDAWLTNHRLKQQIIDPVDTSASVADQESDHDKSNEGRDESEIAPDLLDSYQVAANQPRALYIDKLNIAARLLPMGVNDDGSMQAPYNIFDAGWYNKSAQPSTAGAVVIDAHASGPTRQGLFAYLDTLTKGDTVEVETGDGQRYTYKVVATETVDIDKVDMQKLMLPHGNATHGANFITCTGDWLQDSETYNERAIVYTELVR